MFSKITGRIGKTALTGLVVATLGLGLLGGGAAHAQDNEGGVWTDCYYAGEVYSDGAVIKMSDGNNYRCSSGVWTKQARVAPPKGKFNQVAQRGAVLNMAP